MPFLRMSSGWAVDAQADTCFYATIDAAGGTVDIT